ncbi:hypothetical protein [Lysinibacillus capsici]|uniref:hypothetical protein n=1 Tax=Lysinibacillus capsici TaxID=2115968 RepID=UPI003081DF30|nr:hypothetical protein ICJ70_07480 [Lysinibacillus capsici]
MSIKVWAKIKLPYILRLEREEVYDIELPIDNEFSFFKVIFFPNIDSIDNTNYSTKYQESSCNYVEIEAILKRFDCFNYPILKTTIYKLFDVPKKDMIEIFKLINKKLNTFLMELSKITNMFWIEEIALNPISGVIGTRTDFAFVEPETVIGNARSYLTIDDNYMEETMLEEITPLNNNILESFRNGNYILKLIWHNYLNKATKAMYSSEYEEFIIYCAISAESFIKQIVNVANREDVVLDKLIEAGKNQMVHTYYKIILKYLFGKSLIEVEEVLHKNLIDIFTLRNEIMHRGYLDETSFKKVGIQELNFEQAEIYLSRLNRAIAVCLEIFTGEFRDI